MLSVKRVVFNALLGFLSVLFITGIAQAADLVIDKPISNVTVAVDKNGNEYVRAIVQETRKLGGVEYQAGVPVMFFGETVAIGKTLKAGDYLKAVVTSTEYNGSTSYTLRAIIK